MLQSKSIFILLMIISAFLGSQRAIAQSTDRYKSAVTNADLLVQNNNVRVTNIRLNNTDNGLQLIVETASERQLVPLILPEGNNLVIDLTDAELNLATGNDFRQTNPAPGIAEITATQIDAKIG